MRETFLIAGIEPADQASRDRFGEEHRWVRHKVETAKGRGKWLASILATLVVATVTAACTAAAPLIIRFLTGLPK